MGKTENKLALFIVVLGIGFLFQSCVPKRSMTRQEWLTITTRYYKNVTVDEALNSAEKLFRLADGDDFIFSHTSNELRASRQWIVYVVLAVVFGTDHWSIRATRATGGVEMNIQVATQGSSPAPFFSGPNLEMTGTVSMPMGAASIQGSALYDLFWARMDYLLGKKKEWADCDEAERRKNIKLTWGDLSALCNPFNIKDNMPEELEQKPKGDEVG